MSASRLRRITSAVPLLVWGLVLVVVSLGLATALLPSGSFHIFAPPGPPDEATIEEMTGLVVPEDAVAFESATNANWMGDGTSWATFSIPRAELDDLLRESQLGTEPQRLPAPKLRRRLQDLGNGWVENGIDRGLATPRRGPHDDEAQIVVLDDPEFAVIYVRRYTL